jgi:hypothetical protein
MGLVMGLVTLPLAPVRATLWLTEQLVAAAERELYDPQRLEAELAEAQAAHARGELSDEELDEFEEVVVERLLTRGGAHV